LDDDDDDDDDVFFKKVKLKIFSSLCAGIVVSVGQGLEKMVCCPLLQNKCHVLSLFGTWQKLLSLAPSVPLRVKHFRRAFNFSLSTNQK
jgi:hypothetical protein